MVGPSSAVILLGSAALLLVAAGCGRSTEPPAQQAPAAPPTAAAPSADVAKHMADHFSKVREVEEAIIRGDLEAARAPALWIADHQETTGLPAGTETYVAEMKVAARAVANTSDVSMGAVAAASLVASCGGCHAAAKVTPRLPEAVAPTPGTGRVRHMREHQHAVDLMYRGLVAPSDEYWNKGAAGLKAAPLGTKELPAAATGSAASEARVHELAERATAATDRSARVAIYGLVIGSCANCHGKHGMVWGPGLPKTQ